MHRAWRPASQGSGSLTPILLPAVPPSLLGAGATQEVLGLLGTQVELECRTSGVPTPQVEWTKDRQ